MLIFIAERLSVRHVIVRARRGLSLRLCLYVCMYVCMSVTGLQLKYMSLRIVYVPSGMCPSWCARAHAELVEDLEERRRCQAREHVQRYRRRLSDEKRQYDSEKRRLARQQQSELLRSLTACEQDSEEQHSIVVGRLYTTKVSLP